MNAKKLLMIAACFSFIAAFVHILIIFGGGNWYRFFGAGEQMAQLAESGSIQPIMITLFISLVLFIWGLYALSGSGFIAKLPFLKWALYLISFIYLFRGTAGLVLPFLSNHVAIQQNSLSFWVISSAVCLVIGSFYLFGTLNRFKKTED